MRIVITGGAGFIGTSLARRLAQDGNEIVLIDPLTPQIHGDVPSYRPDDGVRLVRADILSLAERPELVDGADAIFHLAAETGTGQSMYCIKRYVEVNELGTAVLLEAIAKCGRRPARLVLASSRAIYGEGAYVRASNPDALLHPNMRTRAELERGQWDFCADDGEPLMPRPTPESLSPRPSSVYAATKLAQEGLVTSGCAGLGVPVTIFRFQNVFGEGQSLQNPYTGVLSVFLNRARQGLELNVFEDGRESRDFVHVSDVVTALALALTVEHPNGGVYNVGSGQPTTLAEAAERLVRTLGVQVPIRTSGDFRVGDIRHCFADLSAIRRDFGFAPTVSFAEGIARFVAWAGKQPHYEDGSNAALSELRRHGLTS